MFYRLKQAIMCKALERRNAQNPFDAQTADNYTLEGATDPLLNNSYYFSAHNDKMSVFARLGRRVNMDESWFCIYLGGQVYSLQQEFFPSGESPLRVEREGEDWKVSFEGILNGNDEVDFQARFTARYGLITEIGSSLSHGAVVAREYGLPTIVNVKGATKLLKDGDYIVMDAGKGKITLRG